MPQPAVATNKMLTQKVPIRSSSGPTRSSIVISTSLDCEAILIPVEGRIGEIFHYYNGKFEEPTLLQ